MYKFWIQINFIIFKDYILSEFDSLKFLKYISIFLWFSKNIYEKTEYLKYVLFFIFIFKK